MTHLLIETFEQMDNIYVIDASQKNEITPEKNTITIEQIFTEEELEIFLTQIITPKLKVPVKEIIKYLKEENISFTPRNILDIVINKHKKTYKIMQKRKLISKSTNHFLSFSNKMNSLETFIQTSEEDGLTGSTKGNL